MKTILSCFQILIISLVFATPVDAQSFLTNGLVAYYPFNGNANDVSGNGYNGTVHGATLTTNRFGTSSSAYMFNGSSSYIQLPETIFGPTTPAFTVSLWVTTDSNNYPDQIIFEKGPANGEMNVGIGSGQFSFGANLCPPYNFQTLSTPMISNAVTHIVGVYLRGKNIWLYTNGVLATNLSIPNTNLWQSSFPLNTALGIYDYTGGPYLGFRGHIENVRIYTNALTSLQVQQLYQYESTPPMLAVPAITNQPQDVYLYASNNATFTAASSGTPPLWYQWLFNGFDLVGATNTILTVSNVVPANLGQYSVIVTNNYGATTSSVANLYMYPSIVVPFTGLVTTVGQTNIISVTAWGSGTLTYQWYDSGNVFLNATNSTLIFSNIQLTNAGSYSVVVSSSLGSATNAGAQVVVNVPATPPMITSFTPMSALDGTNITITGMNFSTVMSSNIVYFGSVRAAITAATLTNLVVTVPVGATFAPITVTVNGLTGYSDQPFMPTFLGNGVINSSSLESPLVIHTSAGPAQTIFADLDGDGRPDLVEADAYSADVSIYQNISSNGILSFASPVVLPIVPASYGNILSIAVADIDGDGKLDIIANTSRSNLIYVFRNISSPGMLTTNSFASPVIIPAGLASERIAVQDLNGDGKPDIVIPNTGSNTISILQNESTIGSISFGSPVNFFTGNYPTDVKIADLDGDGYPDIIVPNFNDNTVSIFRNLGIGENVTTNSFSSPVMLTGIPQAHLLKIGDMDGDGKLDIVVADWANVTMTVIRNLTTGPGITTNSFAPSVSFTTGGWACNVELGDLSGDGKLDIAVPDQLPSLFSIFQNTSTPGSFTTNSLTGRVDFSSGWDANDATMGDLNGDGRPDIAIANIYDNTVYVLLNNVPTPLPSITNEPQDIYVNPYDTASFNVGVVGATPLSYQWLFNGSNILNATNDIFTVTNIVQANLGQYFVVITNSFGTATSSVANMYMYPTIVDPFTGFITESGQTNTLSIGAWGSGVLTYQWYDNGIAIFGATNATLIFSDIQFTNAGFYSVVASDFLGSVTNATAEVVVNPPGFSIGLYPGIMVTGTAGNTYVIQSNPDLSNSNGWTTLGTITLTVPVQLWVDTNIDASLPANPRHFYRLVPNQ